MPLPTFFNIDDQKRERFLEMAFTEFSSKPYDLASITAIVKQMGLAKGSFYQYFENKKALFVYLVEYAENLKLEFLDNELKKGGKNVFKWFGKYLAACIKFEIAHPLQAHVLGLLAQDYSSTEIMDVANNFRLRQNQFFIDRIKERDKKKGTIKNKENLAFFMQQIAEGISAYFFKNVQRINKTAIRNQNPVVFASQSEIQDFCLEVSNHLKTGFET